MVTSFSLAVSYALEAVNIVFAGTVAINDGLDEVLRDIVEIGKELLGILR